MVFSVNPGQKETLDVIVNTRNVLKVQAAIRIDKLNVQISFKSFLATPAGPPVRSDVADKDTMPARFQHCK
jgi:hypothetical protein